MRYQKPELLLSDFSLRLVQGGANDKPSGSCRDAGAGGGTTTGAYEIDE